MDTKKYNIYRNFIGGNLYDFAYKHTKPEYAKMLLGQKHKPTINFINNRLGKKYIDKRDALQFAQNKILEHLTTQYLIELAEEYGYVLSKIGCEGNDGKLFVSDKYVTCEPDLEWDGHLIELQQDTFGNTTKQGRVYLRINKLPNLQRYAKKMPEGKNIYLVSIDITNRLMYTIKIDDTIEAKKHDHIPWFGGKPAYSIALKDFKVKKI